MAASRLPRLLCVLVAAVSFAGCGTVHQNPNWNPNPVSVSVTASAATVDGTDSVTVNAAVTNDRNSGGVTWTASGGGTLANSTATSTTYTAPQATTTAQSITVTATSVADPSKSAAVMITVPAAPAITTTALAGASAGTAYSAMLSASGGIQPYTFSVSTGSLPAGLTLSSTGAITGTPLASGVGTTTVTFKVTDSGTANALSATKDLSITVDPALVVTTTSLPTGYQGVAYATTTLAATGGTGTGYTWSWAAAAGSTLPAGLTLSPAGVISGTPTASGTSNVVVTVKDSGNHIGVGSLSITIEPALTITTTSPLRSAVATVAYSQTFAATGGSGTGYTWSVTAGATSLAAVNLSLSPAGVLSGTPAAAGSANFTVQVTDSLGHTASAVFALTVNSALKIDTTSLPATDAGQAYSQTLAASGGSGTGYTWTTTGTNNLASFNLSLSAAGVLSGTPSTSGTATFTAQVTDSFGDTATMPLTVLVYSALSLPAPDPGSLPSSVNAGVDYSGTITGSGGSGTYAWTVTGLSDNLTSSSSGNTLTVSGTPTTQATVTFSVKLTDTTTNQSITQAGYYITVGAPLPLTLPTPNPSSLPTAYVNYAYAGSVSSSGGVGPYTWTINGVTVTGAGLALSDGLSASNTGNNTLTITGTPTSAGTVTLTSVQVRDSKGATATATTYTIAVALKTSKVSGQIALNNICGTVSVPAITVSINTTPVQTTTTDGSGNFTFAAVPDGSYTITPSISGASSVFYPASLNVSVTGSDMTGQNFRAALGYTVAGAVSYAGGDTGRVYLNLVNPACNGNSLGTSLPFSAIAGGGAFTIHGVPPGSYSLYATIDNLGQGEPNATNPTANIPVAVTNASVSGLAITPVDPTVSAPSAAPVLNSITPVDLGVAISFKPMTDSSGVETVTFYTIEWSTNSGFTGVSSLQTKAVGTGADVRVITNNITGVNFSNGTAYYFRVRGETSTGPGPWTVWGGGTPQAVMVNAPSGYNTVSGAVTIPADITPSGPLYVGYYDETTGSMYATIVPVGSLSNTVPNTYSVSVPTGSTYRLFAILDQNSDGVADAGDVSNAFGGYTTVAISGATSGQDVTLPDAGATGTVQTQYISDTTWNGTAASTLAQYYLNFNVGESNKLPVAVQLTGALMTGGGSPNVLFPVDVGNVCPGCGYAKFNYFAGVSPAMPSVGDAYTFQVTYSDATTATVTASVRGVIQADLLPSNLYATGTLPIFSWYNWPATAANTLFFYLWDNSGNVLWQIPAPNLNSPGFPISACSTGGSMSCQINYPTDPTGNTSNNATAGVLTAGQVYIWAVTTVDATGDTSTAKTYFIP